MKNFKNIISLVITVVMLATMFALPMSASAADTQLFFDDMEAHDLSLSITGTADTAGRSGAGSKAGRNPCKTPADHKGRISGNDGCRPVCIGSGIAGNAPC